MKYSEAVFLVLLGTGSFPTRHVVFSCCPMGQFHMKTNFFYKFLLSFVVLTHVATIFSMPRCYICKKSSNGPYYKRTSMDHLIKKHLQCPWCDAQPFLKKISFFNYKIYLNKKSKTSEISEDQDEVDFSETA